MRLLIVTQVVDRKDPILGFFHRWLEVFAGSFSRIEVICLSAGEHTLPATVRVHSLGKEQGGRSSLTYALRFYRTMHALRGQYDAVFVHMNPEYVVLAGWYWRLMKKRVALWYNHQVRSLWLRVAHPFTSIVFHTSPFAATARFKNAVRMPAGIDTEIFKPVNINKKPLSVYFQGRVAPAKKVHVILHALRILRTRGIDAKVTIVGPEEPAYGKTIRAEFRDLIEQEAAVFLGPIPNYETPSLYAEHAASVNLTAAGNYDKTVLESMACGTPAVVSSKAFTDLVPAPLLTKSNPADVAATLQRILTLTKTSYEVLQAQCTAAAHKHSLVNLANQLTRELA